MPDSGSGVSLLLFAYNHERFIEAAVRSALAQDCDPIEILISDNGSTDATLSIIRAITDEYDGPHHVTVLQQPRNRDGYARHMSAVAPRARGRTLVIASGDDISLPHRVRELSAAFQRNRRVTAAFSHARRIDQQGADHGRYAGALGEEAYSLEKISQRIISGLGATLAFDRRVFDVFGPLPAKNIYEDVVVPYRAALFGEVTFVDQDLVLYREHTANVYLADPFKVTTEGVRQTLLRQAPAKQHIFLTRITDLKTAQKTWPSRTEEFARLKKMAQRLLREMSYERAVLESASVVRRLRLCIAGYRDGVRTRAVARWLLTLVWPRCFLWYVRALFRFSNWRVRHAGAASVHENSKPRNSVSG